MLKRIFITGGVREYDSTKPDEFVNGIENFIKENLADENSRENIAVNVREVSPNQIVVVFPFTTGEETPQDSISHELYRCFFGECSKFRSQYSLGCGVYLGSYVKTFVFEDIKSVKTAHRRNTKFYGADNYKKLDIVENKYGLEVRFTF